MRHQLIDTAKRIVRPITRQRFKLERWKYRHQAILEQGAGNRLLAERLRSGLPTAAGKLGASEVGGMCRWVNAGMPELVTSWGKHRTMLTRNAGVYPDDDASLTKWCRLYADAMGEVDVLAVWFQLGEAMLQHRFAPEAKLVGLQELESYFHNKPWTAELAGKRVTVITPFASSVQRQYARRKDVWASHPSVLPEFELSTIRCPLSATLADPEYPDWFAGLDAMTEQMEKLKSDVVMIGAGAWSLPLAARAKRMGRFGIHLGGGMQVLFGIRGARWDTQPEFDRFFNDAWVRPGEDEKPKSFRAVENGCYW